MKYLMKICLVFFAMITAVSCLRKEKTEGRESIDEITIDTSFAGARLSKFQKTEEGKYVGYVLPENEPVNTSPWFAFALESEEEKQIELQLKYGTYQHRYIPKLSYDKINWKPLTSSKIKIDTAKHMATLFLNISSEKLYVAAQEVEPSARSYAWVDSMLTAIPNMKKSVAGKTVLDHDNYVLQHENEEISNSLVLIARQHPPEIPGGTFGFKSFFETVFSNTDLAKQFRDSYNIYTFPLLNPDGADLGNWRHNANGVDLNRDWVEFSQPETQMVKKFIDTKIKSGMRIRFAIDFHTSHTGPYLLVLDSINEKKTDKITAGWIAEIEATTDFDVNDKRRSQELPYCYNYFFNQTGSEAVTYEDGDEVDRTIIKKKAKNYAEALMKILLQKGSG